MVAKRASADDPLGSAVKALAAELEAAAQTGPASEAVEAERRAKALVLLLKAAESLSALLRERQTRDKEQASERSAQETAARYRDGEVWAEIERRLARLRAAQIAAADHQAAGTQKAGGAAA